MPFVCTRSKGPADPGIVSDQQTVSLIQRQPGTARFAAENQLPTHVDGVGQQVELYGYRGDASWIGYSLLSGRWFTGPGETVVPQALLDAAHKKVGDLVVVNLDGHHESLRVVGTIFDQQNGDILLRADWSALTGLSPTIEPRAYEVQISGVDPGQYAQQLDAASATPSLRVQTRRDGGLDTAFLLIEGVLTGLALVLTGIALAGVFNTVVLNPRKGARHRNPAGPGHDSAPGDLDGAHRRRGHRPPGHRLRDSRRAASAAADPHRLGTGGGFLPGAHPPLRRLPHRDLAGLGTAGMTVALAGAWLPATWATRNRISTVLSAK